MAGTESCSRSCSSLSDREPGRASAPSAIRPVVAYDGCSADDLAARLGVPGVAMFDDVGSTLDVAHALAADGAPAGTVVLADAQSAGRGRHGRRWRSERGAGIWLTILERPSESKALEVLSPNRTFLNLDCGFGTFASRPMNSHEIVRAKLASMVGAAKVLRRRYDA